MPHIVHVLHNVSFRAYSGDVKVQFLMVALVGCVWAQVPAVRLPRFEDYPVKGLWQGRPPSPKLPTPSERMFRTNLTNAAKEQPNFAGHYRVTYWGCGSNCSAVHDAGAVVLASRVGNSIQAGFADSESGRDTNRERPHCRNLSEVVAAPSDRLLRQISRNLPFRARLR